VKLFLDTAEIGEIRIAARWGVLDGVTTNPTLFAKVGGTYDDVLREICAITPGPVSAEVVAERRWRGRQQSRLRAPWPRRGHLCTHTSLCHRSCQDRTLPRRGS
jgi:hypothetical protein